MQFEIETQVATGRIRLMDFDGQDVVAVLELVHVYIKFKERRFVSASDDSCGKVVE